MSDRDAKPGTLYYGDCLDVMREWPDRFVDLCYLDPPFNSKADYNILFGGAAGADKQQTLAFTDTWHWDAAAAERTRALKRAGANPARDVVAGLHTALGDCGMMAYLSYMAERLVEIRRVLKDTGSICLHCDPTAGAYLKVVMDAVFGHANFRNEIVWRIGWISGFKSQKRGWIRNHDTLLYHVRSPAAVPRFNKEYIPYPPDYVRRDGKKPTGKGVPLEDTWNCSSADVLDSIIFLRRSPATPRRSRSPCSSASSGPAAARAISCLTRSADAARPSPPPTAWAGAGRGSTSPLSP